jgi:hypothetical protein
MTRTTLTIGAVALYVLAAASHIDAQTAVTQTAYIKASNTQEGDEFGYAVAVSGDGTTMAISAPHENSSVSGVNANQADEKADDSGAVYIFTRSGGAWTQQAYLKASNPDQFDQFGNALALSRDGNTLVVAAYFEDSNATGVNGNQADNSIAQAGAAYVFVRRGTAWSQQAYLKASNTGEPDDGDQFGLSVAISGDGNTIAVGAPTEDSNATGINGNQKDNSSLSEGAVYLFARTGTTWAQQAYIKSDGRANQGAGDLFGYSVALSANGDTLGVGAFDEGGAGRDINAPLDSGRNGSGAVYVFVRNAGAWKKEAYIKPRESDTQDAFGGWIAMSDDGNTLLAGAQDEDTLASGLNAVKSGDSGKVDAPDDLSTGAAYLFTRSGTTWRQEASFKASNTGKQDWFGHGLALSGDGRTFAVAAPNEDSKARGINGDQADNSAEEAGAVYVFRKTGTNWAQVAYVKASNADAFDEFGSGVALTQDGSVMVVGAHYEDSASKGPTGGKPDDNSALDAGAAYVFSIK